MKTPLTVEQQLRNYIEIQDQSRMALIDDLHTSHDIAIKCDQLARYYRKMFHICSVALFIVFALLMFKCWI